MSFNGRDTSFNETMLVNDGFFADVALADFQNLHRIPSKIADAAIWHQLLLAMDSINASLATEIAAWIAAGHATLVEVDQANKTKLATVYKSAIYYRAKAKLLVDFQTLSRRDKAENIAQEGSETYENLLAESRRAVRRLKGQTTGIGVELL